MGKVKLLGLPGSGKSTILKEMEKIKNKKCTFSVIHDRMVQSQDLKCLAENMKQNTITFQTKLVENFLNETIEEPYADIIIDHTPIEMVEFFNTSYTIYNYMTDYNWDHICQMIKKVKENEMTLRGFVYIFAPVETCIRNMRKRNRLYEPEYDKRLFEQINILLIDHYDKNPNPKILLDYEEGVNKYKVVYDFLMQLQTEVEK